MWQKRRSSGERAGRCVAGRIARRRGIHIARRWWLVLTIHRIAHELTHAFTFAHLGLGARGLWPLQGEGYADYVALGPYPNLRAGREALKRNDFEMNVTASGRYDRYRLLVS